ncbi:MAG: alpha/beta fold hydrolase [Pseudomonadota bacterium]
MTSSERPLILVHGVPDTKALWDGVVAELRETRRDVHAMELPGFGVPLPSGFACTKEAYAAWLAEQAKAIAEAKGPVDIVGHDWGALLTLRVVSLNPDWFASWAISGATLHESYGGHLMARIWATPVLGEIAMALSSPSFVRRVLTRNGMPPDLVEKEVAANSEVMRSAILKLYRSARGLRIHGEWLDELASLPAKGMALWGAHDPYVRVETAKLFAEKQGVPLKIHDGAGHWVVAQQPAWIAKHLHAFWDEQERGGPHA